MGDTPTLAIALGANLPSPVGGPIATLLAVRPLLEARVQQWGHGLAAGPFVFRWSPLFETEPVGGPPGQPNYINAVVMVDGLAPRRPGVGTEPAQAAAERLLRHLQGLEQGFGRERPARWAPRSLDLDLLWWGELRSRSEALELPHPRLLERSFVLAPLAAIDPALLPPGADAGASTLLSRLKAMGSESAPERLMGRPGWPEKACTPGEDVLCMWDGANA